MTKVKKTDHLFQKGVAPNPEGRPKGAISEVKRKSIELRKKAIEDIDTAYNELRSSMQIGEAWAHQIYFKELVPFNKHWLTEVDVSDLRKEVKSIDDISVALAELVSKLLSVDSMSTEEMHSLIKTLNNIKLTEQFGRQNKDVETPEQYEARMQDIKLFTQWKRERNQNINS